MLSVPHLSHLSAPKILNTITDHYNALYDEALLFHHSPSPKPSTSTKDRVAATRDIADWIKNKAVGKPPEFSDVETQVPVIPAPHAMKPTQKPPTICQSGNRRRRVGSGGVVLGLGQFV